MAQNRDRYNVGSSMRLTIGGRTYDAAKISHPTINTEDNYRQSQVKYSFTAQTTSPIMKSENNVKAYMGTQAQTENAKGVSSKTSMQSVGLDAAYYVTLAAGRHDSMKSNIDASRVQTSTLLDEAAESRAKQAMLQAKYTPAHILTNVGMEAKTSFYDSMQKYSNEGVSFPKYINNDILSGAGLVTNKAEKMLGSNDDLGSQAVSGLIGTGKMVYVTVPLTKRGVVTATSTVKHSYKIVRGIADGSFIISTTNAAKRSFRLVRGVVNGSVMKSSVTYKNLMRAVELAKSKGITVAGKRIASKGIKIAGKAVVDETVKGGVWAFKRGIPQAARGLSSMSMGIAGTLASSDDMMLQGAGDALYLANYGLRTSIVAGRITGRVVKTSVKGSIKTVKGTYNAFSFIRKKGLRAAWQNARNKAAKAILKAGKSVVTVIINLAKALANKVIVPVIIIVVIAALIVNVFAAPVAAVGGIFGSLFDMNTGDGTYKETDIRSFITDPNNGIPALRAAYVKNLYESMQSELKVNGGQYDKVKFKTNVQEEAVEPTIEGISNSFYTDEQLANIIQPIFNGVILKDYELAPTEAEAKKVLEKIFESLFRIEEEEENPDDSGEESPDDSEEESPDDSEEENPDDSEEENPDDGLTETVSDSVLIVTLNMDGIYQLLSEYFEEPINKLSSKENRTEDEENQLASLKDYHEITLEYISQVSKDYGTVTPNDIPRNPSPSHGSHGDQTKGNFNGVQFVNGSRVGNQKIVDIALAQVGQVGGRPYWSWYGFSSRVEWCACFVSWCMHQVGHNEVKYASCESGGVPYFKKVGRFANGKYKDVVAGDVIFFDWDADGRANHTGLVAGTDGKYIYTVEGNSGDRCRTKRYPVGSSVIRGFGLMNW